MMYKYRDSTNGNLKAVRGENFLQALLGADCTRALSEAVSRSPGLADAVAPRAMVSWLAACGPSFTGGIPGCPALVSFQKSDGSYTGRVTVGSSPYEFEDLPPLQMTALLVVAAGLDAVYHDGLSSRDLARLGKSLDTMVAAATRPPTSAELLRQFDVAKNEQLYCSRCKDPLDKDGHCKIKAHWAELDKIETPGAAVAPAAPQAAAQQTGPVPPKSPTKQASKQNAGAAQTQVPGVTGGLKIPKVSPKRTLKVEKHEAARPCGRCRGSRFDQVRFVGCACFSELAKHVDTRSIEGGFLLTFSASVEPEAFVALAATLRRR